MQSHCNCMTFAAFYKTSVILPSFHPSITSNRPELMFDGERIRFQKICGKAFLEINDVDVPHVFY